MNKARPNDSCPCGSGKKFKKCCAAADQNSRAAKTTAPASGLVKTAEEIEGIRRACRFNAELMVYIKPRVVAGISTDQIDRWVHAYTLDHGHIPAPLNYHGFPKSVCTSLNSVVCHGIPSKKDILKEGDIINVDLTTIVDGFFGDQSETLYIGENICPEARKVTEVSRESLKVALRTVRPDIALYEVCGAIQDYVEAHDCSVVREFTGHGIGRQFHEEPQVPHYRTPESKRVMLEPGMVFTIEPMVNLGHWKTKVLSDRWTAVTADGSLSAQFEHTILVNKTGCEIMTAIPGSEWDHEHIFGLAGSKA